MQYCKTSTNNIIFFNSFLQLGSSFLSFYLFFYFIRVVMNAALDPVQSPVHFSSDWIKEMQPASLYKMHSCAAKLVHFTNILFGRLVSKTENAVMNGVIPMFPGRVTLARIPKWLDLVKRQV